MTVEYVVLGIVLVLMGVVQIWLRHGPGARDGGVEGPPTDVAAETGSAEARSSEARSAKSRSSGGIRSGRAWDAWTAVLGGIGVAVGIALIVVGALGR